VAMSSGWPTRPSGMRAKKAASRSSPLPLAPVAAVAAAALGVVALPAERLSILAL
jgi:hypothetical protein